MYHFPALQYNWENNDEYLRSKTSRNVKCHSVCWSQILNPISNLCPSSEIQSAADTLVVRGREHCSDWGEGFDIVNRANEQLAPPSFHGFHVKVLSAERRSQLHRRWRKWSVFSLQKKQTPPKHLCIVKENAHTHTHRHTRTAFMQAPHAFKLYYLWPWGSLNSLWSWFSL